MSRFKHVLAALAFAAALAAVPLSTSAPAPTQRAAETPAVVPGCGLCW